jgi:predicted ATP-dependent endonuclease of OLD family
MRVKRIEVRGFRSFLDKVEINDLAPVNTFVGRNNAGKTNAIEILRFVRHLSRGETYKQFVDIVSAGSTTVEISLAMELDEGERRNLIEKIFVKSKVKPDAVIGSRFVRTLKHKLLLYDGGIKSQEVTIPNIIDGDISVWRMSRDGAGLALESVDLFPAAEQLGQSEDLITKPESRGGTNSAVWDLWWSAGATDILPSFLRDFYSWKIEWIPPIRQSSVRATSTEARELDDSAGNLPQVISTIGMEEPRNIVEISRILADVANVDTIQPRLKGNECWPAVKEKTGLSFDLGNTSSGIHQAMILVTKIATCPKGGILLIEEPELHLHAEAQRALRRFIQNSSKMIQFFITTHSTIFANLGSDSRVYLVTKKTRQSLIRPVEEPSELVSVKWELGHSNADLYGFDLVLFVEGDSEEVAFPIIANSLGYDFGTQGIKLINIKGNKKAQKLEQYLEYLKESDTAPFVICDSDAETAKRLQDWEESRLLPHGNYRIWPLEFEDLFQIELIVRCLGELGYTEMDKGKLVALRGTSSIVHAIKRVIHETAQADLDKPSLAEAIARSLTSKPSDIPDKLIEALKAAVSAATVRRERS